MEKAARKHRLSQSAMSQAIAALEKVLQLPLLLHERRVVRVTDEATAIIPLLEDLVAKAETLKTAANELKSSYGGPLRLGCTHSLAIGILPPVLQCLRMEAPAIQVSVLVGNSEVLTRALNHQEIDLALYLRDSQLNESLTATILSKGQYIVIKHRKDKRPLQEAGLIVTRRQRAEVMTIRQDYRQEHGVEIPITMEIISWESIKRCVTLGQGYGLIPNYALQAEDQKAGIVPVELGITLPEYELISVTRRGSPPGRNTQLILRYLQANAETFETGTAKA